MSALVAPVPNYGIPWVSEIVMRDIREHDSRADASEKVSESMLKLIVEIAEDCYWQGAEDGEQRS